MELKVTEEFVREAHSAACSTWKQRIEKEFPELFKMKLEVGKWYYNEKYNIVFYLEEFKYDNVFNGYGFNKDKEWFSNNRYVNIYAEYCNREATHEEVESALIAEAKKRGYTGKEIVLIEGRLHGVYLETKIKDNCSCSAYKSYIIFKDGEWAEILPEEKTIITKEKALKILAKKLKVSPKSIEIQ